MKDTTTLLLCGEPIDEPIVGQGPFVMDTAQEIRQAMADYWSRPDAAQWAEAYSAVFPQYQLLIESYAKAQEVVTKHEVLDSQR